MRGAPSVEKVLQPGEVGKQQEGLVEAVDEAHKVAGGERTAQDAPASAGRVVEQVEGRAAELALLRANALMGDGLRVEG